MNALVGNPEIERILEVLQLGATAEDVARILKGYGIRGVRNTCRMLNPIVRLVRREIPDAWDIDVIEGDRVHIVLDDECDEHIPLPDSVMEFLNDFNDGAYPRLEIPPEQI